MSKSKPTQMPPVFRVKEDGTNVLTDSRPTDLTAMDQAVLEQVRQSAPTMEPPAEVLAAAQDGVMAWVNDKRVNSLWSKAENRNSWIGVTGVGWKKLSTASDSGIMALTLLAATARVTNGRIDYREEADGMIHECTIW